MDRDWCLRADDFIALENERKDTGVNDADANKKAAGERAEKFGQQEITKITNKDFADKNYDHRDTKECKQFGAKVSVGHKDTKKKNLHSDTAHMRDVESDKKSWLKHKAKLDEERE